MQPGNPAYSRIISKQWVVALVLIFLLAFAARAAYAFRGSQALTFDEPYYDHIASQLLAGHGFTFAFSAYSTSIPNQPTSMQEPIFPLLLALLKLVFGPDNHLGPRMVLGLIGALIPVIAGLWGGRIFGRGGGLLAAIVLAFYPPLVYFGRFLMTETLYITLLLTGLIIISTKGRPGWLLWVGGAVLGLACLTRTMLFFFIPVLFLWQWLINSPPKAKALGAAMFTLFGIVSMIAPWTVRNYFVHHAFVPITTKGGWNLYYYNYPVVNYDFNGRGAEIQWPDVNGLSEVEREDLYFQKGLGFIMDNPGLFASFAWAKFIDFWNPLLKGANRGLSLLNIVSFGMFTLLAFAGLARYIVKRNMPPTMILFWLLIGYYMTQALVFTGGGKARLPIEPLIVLLGSEALWSAIIGLRERFTIPTKRELVES